MSLVNDSKKRLERLALTHVLAVLVCYAQLIEVMTALPPFVAKLGGPLPFILLGTLAIAAALVPVLPILRGRLWGIVCSWILLLFCLLDGSIILLRYLRGETSMGVIAAVGLIVAGILILGQLIYTPLFNGMPSRQTT